MATVHFITSKSTSSVACGRPMGVVGIGSTISTNLHEVTCKRCRNALTKERGSLATLPIGLPDAPLVEVGDYQVIEGFVYCIQRGTVHDALSPRSTPRHGGTVFWDLYEDGELCNPAEDHFPVAAQLPEGFQP